MPTMPYSPFTCHQEFLWVDHGEKFSMLRKYLCNIQTQQNLDLTIILAQNLSSVQCITQFLLDNHYPTTYYHEGHTEDQLANNTFTGQIPGANQHIEWQEVALQKQMHMSVAM